MAGINRIFRPPGGINGKPRHVIEGVPWRVRLAAWNPELRYSPEQIAAAFSISLNPPPPRLPTGATVDRQAAIKAFIHYRAALRAAGMLKMDGEKADGWIDIYCPWTEEHTGSVDNGAAICSPSEENWFNGAFKCHHGACAGRHWGHLTAWITAQQAELLEIINANEKGLSHYDR